MPRRGRQAGFTLLELLVAFMVLVLAFTVMLRIFSGGLQGVGDAQSHSRAVEHARARLALAQAEQPLRIGEHSGETSDGYPWRLTVEAVDDTRLPGEELQLLRLTARVNWGARQERAVRLWTLRVQDAGGPGLAGTGGRP